MSEADKYQVAAARVYHSLYKTNFYSTSTEFQRKWTEALKEYHNEVGPKRDT